MTEGKQLVFICGLHRSGTSLLQDVIAGSKDVSVLKDSHVPENEGQHLQEVYSTAKEHGGPGRFALDPAAYMDENHDAVSPKAADQIINSWAPFWDDGGQIFVEKSPINTVRCRFLQALFPMAKFISIWRHPLAVAEATKKWTEFGIDDLIEHWIAARTIYEADKAQLNQQLQISYESLVNSSEDCIARINNFLHIELAAPLLSDANSDYFKAWENPKALWRIRELSDLRAKYENQLNDLGYSLTDFAVRPDF